jgi:hypothetical protein
MPLLRGRRPLKRWRYVGVFSEELMLCAGDVHVGPFRQTFWAIWDRARGRLHERTRLRGHGHVELGPGRVRVRDGEVSIELELDEEEGVEVVCPHGRQYVWTRKQGGVTARGQVTLEGRPHALEARAVIDDTAGYHARETAWKWSAGVGRTERGAAAAWNLVTGINDQPNGSERTVWVEGTPAEVAPVRFAADLDGIDFADGAHLDFVAETERARRDNLIVLLSDYRQPFGRFSGTLPGGERLESGYGVMEQHRARW